MRYSAKKNNTIYYSQMIIITFDCVNISLFIVNELILITEILEYNFNLK